MSQFVSTTLKNFEMDLDKKVYDKETYEKYILGSAEVVGLMCLKIFVQGNQSEYEKLKPHAMILGSAFQKINFLRDIKDDINQLGRVYFPNVQGENFNEQDKKQIEVEIQKEFGKKYMSKGILEDRFPADAQLAATAIIRAHHDLETHLFTPDLRLINIITILKGGA